MSRPGSELWLSRFLLATFLLFAEGRAGDPIRSYRWESWRSEARPPAVVLVVGEPTRGLGGRRR